VSQPVIIEVAINGATRKTANPHVPISEDEIVADALACFEAGAAIVHHHIADVNLSGCFATRVSRAIRRSVVSDDQHRPA
jgi:3-keto-5-aminohexanoate cleavage enzyme